MCGFFKLEYFFHSVRGNITSDFTKFYNKWIENSVMVC